MRGHSHVERDIAECNNEKYRSGPVFIFNRVAACDFFAHDSSRVHWTVQLPGATTKNSIYFFGWCCMWQCVHQTGSKVRFIIISLWALHLRECHDFWNAACYVLVERSTWGEQCGCDWVIWLSALEACASNTLWEQHLHGHKGDTGFWGHGVTLRTHTLYICSMDCIVSFLITLSRASAQIQSRSTMRTYCTIRSMIQGLLSLYFSIGDPWTVIFVLFHRWSLDCYLCTITSVSDFTVWYDLSTYAY